MPKARDGEYHDGRERRHSHDPPGAQPAQAAQRQAEETDQPAFQRERHPLQPVVMQQIEKDGRMNLRARGVAAAAEPRPGGTEFIEPLLQAGTQLAAGADAYDLVLEISGGHAAIGGEGPVVADALDALRRAVIVHPTAVETGDWILGQAGPERLGDLPGGGGPGVETHAGLPGK